MARYIAVAFDKENNRIGYFNGFGLESDSIGITDDVTKACIFKAKKDILISDGTIWKKDGLVGHFKIEKYNSFEAELENTPKQMPNPDENVSKNIQMSILDYPVEESHLKQEEFVPSAKDIEQEQAIAESFGKPVGNEIGNLTPEEIFQEKVIRLNLQKPICFYDVETTGLDTGNDRIISISVIKIMPTGEKITKKTYVNPVIPITEEATAIHGITNEMLMDSPKFNQIAKSIHEFMRDSYLAGYNISHFDNSILQEEFMRCGIDFPRYDVVSLDACNIFKTFEKRDLASAVKFYCGKQLENAHDADADNNATIDVFFAQIEHYEELKGMSLEDISKIGKNENNVDFLGRIIIDKDGDYAWNFGKPKGKKIKNEMGFGDWVLNNNFPQTFKNLVESILTEIRK